MLLELPGVIQASRERPLRLFLASDIHIGSAQLDEDRLKGDLQRARELGARILINGDLFDLILPKDHKRFTPSALDRRLHGETNVINATLALGLEYLGPYADLIDFIGYGNHETSVNKYHSADVLALFIEQLQAVARKKHKAKNHSILRGGYSGFIRIRVQGQRGDKHDMADALWHIFHHHGVGGAAPVTKGMIDVNRFLAGVEGADAIWFGHKHHRFVHEARRFFPPPRGDLVRERSITVIQTGAYTSVGMESQLSRSGSYQPIYGVEKGFAPGGRGGVFLRLHHGKEYAAHAGGRSVRHRIVCATEMTET